MGFELVFPTKFDVLDRVAARNWVSYGISKKNEEPFSLQEKEAKGGKRKGFEKWGFFEGIRGSMPGQKWPLGV